MASQKINQNNNVSNQVANLTIAKAVEPQNSTAFSLTSPATLQDKVRISIARLQEFEPPEGYYLAFSGGKDSEVILDLAKKSGVKFEAHYNVTNVDPPELVRHIKRNHPEVIFHLPAISMWQLIVKKRMPPTRIVRYCCELLKEHGGEGRFIVTGVRAQESRNRKNRQVVELCYTRNVKGKRILNPIVDWLTVDVWAYTRLNDLPICELYMKGYKRLGCQLCPYAGCKTQKREAMAYPWIKERFIKAFDKCVKKRIIDGLPTEWKTGQEMYVWWLTKPKTKAEKLKKLSESFIYD